ncbi:MAG TPA: hypothetical protein VE825_09305 [Terriglobales bacterium]|jgi:hypothetical protein|nr:hypothetical protein [Terriglobales bacterium]
MSVTPTSLRVSGGLRARLRWLPVVALAGLLPVVMTGGQPTESAKAPSITAQELVRQAAQRDLKEEDPPHYQMYRARRELPTGTRVTLRVETPQGPVGRLLMLNDRPLTADQLQDVEKDQQRILHDPDWLAKDQKQYQEESERRRRALAAFPDAFLYDYDGVEPDGLLRIKFRPNPKFDPPFREAQAFPGMEGHVWIDAKTERVVRIETQLFRDVDFGWGIIGRLYKGGHIEIENGRIPDGTWRVTTINVDLSYRILFSKKRAQQKVIYSDFQAVPANLDLAQAVELLRQHSLAASAGK